MRKLDTDQISNSSRTNWGSRLSSVIVLAISLAMLVVACGENPINPDDDDDSNGDDSEPVEVEASFTMEPEEPITGEEVVLDASESSVSNNSDLSYDWSLTTPDDSETELTKNGEVSTSFVPDVAGEYSVELEVSAEEDTDEASKATEVAAIEHIESDISSDRTFTSDVTYIVKNQIDITAELTIEPGTTIEFENETGFEVQSAGSIIADGEEGNEIVFTGTESQSGWWNGIFVRESDNLNNVLDHVTVEYGGGTDFSRSGSGNVIIGRGFSDPSSITITNSTLRHSETYGLWVRSNGDIPDSKNNTYTDNDDAPVSIGSNRTHRLDNGSSYTGNENDYVYVRASHSIEDEDVTWNKLDVPYQLSSSTMEISSVVLTIAEGTTIKSNQDTRIEVVNEGALSAVGTSDNPITFTATDAQPGWWHGIYIRESSNLNNELDYVTVEYAGGENYSRSGSGNVVVGRGFSDDSHITITNSTFQHSGTFGLWVRSNGDIEDSGDNTYSDNQESPVSIGSNNVHLLDAESSYTGNDKDYIEVRGGHDVNSENVTWKNLDVPYQATSSEIEVSGVTLTIDPGTTVQFEQGGRLELLTGSGFIADGTADEPILFTATDEQAGWWDGIYVRESNNQNNVIDNATIEYGGGEDYSRTGAGNLVVGRSFNDDSFISVTNTTIKDSDTYGIYVHENGSANSDVCTENTFENNASDDCRLP